MARFMHGGVIGGLLPASFAWVTDSYRVSISANPVVLSSLDFGDAVSGPNSKWGFVSLLALNDSTVTISSMTIGGIAGAIKYQTTQAAQAATFYGTSTFALWTAQIDSLTSGVTVQFSENTNASIYVQVGYAINIDMSTVIDSAKGTGGSSVALSIDCPAKGGILGHGFYEHVSGTNTGGDFANLTQLRRQAQAASSGSILSASPFSAAQTGLSVAFTPTPSGGNPSAYAVSFAGV